jgi:hypothetical protein
LEPTASTHESIQVKKRRSSRIKVKKRGRQQE